LGSGIGVEQRSIGSRFFVGEGCRRNGRTGRTSFSGTSGVLRRGSGCGSRRGETLRGTGELVRGGRPGDRGTLRGESSSEYFLGGTVTGGS
jgi:hypothetical protein